MKPAGQIIILILAILTSMASAHAQSAGEQPLRTFLVECNSNIDDCRAMLNDFILGGIRISNNSEPTCIPLKRNKAVDMMLTNLRGLARDPEWAEEPYGSALMQAMTDAFPCLTDY
ncbi:MAG: hypothetical protein M1527_02190 [Gammaproteobacteria bacterium]|nr:hypothetical protein [Gammaproteobacteria bacterium]